MADEIDRGNEAAELFLDVALKNKKPEGPSFNVEHCYYCLEPTAYGQRWCDSDCRDDFFKLSAREQSRNIREEIELREAATDED